MMTQNKKRSLSELKQLQTGYRNDNEFLEVCDENKKRKLQSLMDIITCLGYTETDISNYYNQKKYKLWINLISADWFSIFLTYLDIEDIARLDSAFTHHDDRPKWKLCY